MSEKEKLALIVQWNALVKGAMEKVGLPSDYEHMEKQMRERLKQMKHPKPSELLKNMKCSGLLKIYACTPSMEMFGIRKEALVPEVDELAGATTFLNIAKDADVTLLV